MGVFADAGENIEDFTPVRLGILDAVGRDHWQPVRPRKVAQLPIDALLTAKEMPLNFNEQYSRPNASTKNLTRFAKVWGEHALGVLVSASRRNDLLDNSQLAVDLLGLEKFAMARTPSPARETRLLPDPKSGTNPSAKCGSSSHRTAHFPFSLRKCA